MLKLIWPKFPRQYQKKWLTCDIKHVGVPYFDCTIYIIILHNPEYNSSLQGHIVSDSLMEQLFNKFERCSILNFDNDQVGPWHPKWRTCNSRRFLLRYNLNSVQVRYFKNKQWEKTYHWKRFSILFYCYDYFLILIFTSSFLNIWSSKIYMLKTFDPYI